MDSVGIKKAHLIGHSLGAAIALQIASTDEARAASLVLIAPAGITDTINDEFTQSHFTVVRVDNEIQLM